jgi:glutamate synthase domain-containing protein 3
MEIHARVGKKDMPETLSALGRFRNFSPETERDIRQMKVVQNPRLDAILDAWKDLHIFQDLDWAPVVGDSYHNIANLLVGGLVYGRDDVTMFSLMLADLQHEYAFVSRSGIFLSALINNSPEDAFTIRTDHLTKPVHGIGSCNTKEIAVFGNAGHYTGYTMKGGSLTIHGDVGDHIGHGMSGGDIIVHGDAEDYAGEHMTGGTMRMHDSGYDTGHLMGGGKIFIEGSTGTQLGEFFSKGEIHVDGEIKGIARDVEGGKIFHKGKLIVG